MAPDIDGLYTRHARRFIEEMGLRFQFLLYLRSNDVPLTKRQTRYLFDGEFSPDTIPEHRWLLTSLTDEAQRRSSDDHHGRLGGRR